MKATQIEGWVEYGVGVSAILLRIFARYKTVGLRKWKGDDYLIFVCLITFTVQMVIHVELDKYGRYLGIVMGHQVDLITDAILEDATMNSKWGIASWLVYTTLVWSLKGCVVFFYMRLTTGLYQARLVRGCGILVLATYLAMMMMISIICTPVTITWDMMRNNKPVYCQYGLPNFYVLGTINILLDILLLCAIFPILQKAKLSWRKKLALGVLIMGGVFTIIASILNNVMALLYITDSLYGTLHHKFSSMGPDFMAYILQWGAREMCTAILVVNIPCIKPLFSPKKWVRGSSRGSNRSGGPHGAAEVVKGLFTRRMNTRDSDLSLVEFPYKRDSSMHKPSRMSAVSAATKGQDAGMSMTTTFSGSVVEKQDFAKDEDAV